MKKLFFILLGSSLFISCKKQTDITPTSVDSSYIKQTGLIPSAETELQNIPDVKNLDTALIPIFGIVSGLPPTASINVPSPGNQNPYNSCVGWAVGYGMLGYQYKVIEGHSDYNGSDRNFSPNYIWNQLNGGANTGISMASALNLIKNQGCCKLVDMAINVAPNIQPSATARANAANYQISEYSRFFTIDFDRMKAWLSKGHPIAVAIKVDHAFMKNDESPFEKQPDGRLVWKKYSTNEREGHAVLICGYDDGINAFKILNSWGSNWGNSGFIWVDYDFFKTAVSYTLGLFPEIYLCIIKRPILLTNGVNSISQTGAQSGGTITYDWGVSVSSRGVCWNTSHDPNINGNKTIDGSGIGSFTSLLTGLSANTTYYLKAYATNSIGTSYGYETTFTTSANQITIPTLSTAGATSITQTTAFSGGNISSDGGSPVLSRGVCWSITSNPTIANSKTIDGSGTGNFTSSLTGLTANTTYHARAYATNASGTGYGNEIIFTAQQNSGNTVTDIDGNVYNTVTIGTQVWMAENLKTTRYKNGIIIPQITDGSQWGHLTTGAWCYYNNAQINEPTYGKLYNWYSATDPNGLAPQGWHIPTDAEWSILTNFLGGSSIAGGNMKESGTNHWLSPNTGATNTSGFTGLPGGYRVNGNGNQYGIFGYINQYGVTWSYSQNSPTNGSCRYLTSTAGSITWTSGEKNNGFSIRCLKD